MKIHRIVLAATAVAGIVLACTGGPGDVSSGGINGVVGSSGGGARPTPPNNSSSSSGSSGNVPDSGDPPAPAPFACGTTMCQPTQYCVNPCCGGAPPYCYASDAATCPTGFHKVAACTSGASSGQAGCEQDPCKLPPPYCITAKSSAPAGCTSDANNPRNLSCVCS